MVKREREMSSVLLMVVCVIAMSISSGLAQLQPKDLPFPVIGLSPPGIDKELKQCWSSLQDIQGCVLEMFSPFYNGQVRFIGPACCKAITEINENCWPKMFPFNPFFPPLLKAYCTNNKAPVTTPKALGTIRNNDDTSKVVEGESLARLGLLDPEIRQCLTSLQSVEGCVEEVISSFLSFQVRLLGPVCCKAIIEVNDKCWPKIFPFNPFFPPLLKNYCTSLVTIAPRPTKQISSNKLSR